MTINLQDLKSTFTLDTNPLQAGAKLAIAGVAAVVAGIGIAAKATMDWASDLDSLGDVMDGTNDEFAAMAFIARKSGVGVDKLSKGVTILNKGLVKADGTLDTVGQDLKDFGIEVLDANGNVRDQSDLMSDIARKYASFSTQQERVNFLTKTFGRSGADLVDFFDTLAADGGIDKVAEKVKNLGLAIDPDRYEQFNRNLEEMKLIGTGLAVQFTEKLMPVLEDFTDWLMDKGIPNTLAFKKKLEGAFKAGGIKELLKVLDEEISNGLDNLDWEGYGDKFGDLIEGALTNASGEIDVPKSLKSLGNGIRDFFISAAGQENVDAFAMLFKNLDVFVKFEMDQVNKDLIAKTDEGMAKFWAENNDGLNKIKFLYDAWRASNLGTMATWGIALNSSVISSMSKIKASIDRQLSAISEEWQKRTGAWMRKSADALNSQKNALLNAVQGIVDEINAILKTIKTSFNISFSFSTSQSGASGSSNLGGNSNVFNQNEQAGQIGGRATGGAVLAAHAYDVVELNKREKFTPFTAGRIDPVTDKPITARIPREDLDYMVIRLSEKLAQALG